MHRIRRFLGLLSLLFVVLCARGAYAASCTIGTSISNGECRNGLVWCDTGYFVLANSCYTCIGTGLADYTDDIIPNGNIQTKKPYKYTSAGNGGPGDGDAQCYGKTYGDTTYQCSCALPYYVYIDDVPYYKDGALTDQVGGFTSYPNCSCKYYSEFNSGPCTSTQYHNGTSCVACPQNALCNGDTFTCVYGYKTNATNDGCVPGCVNNDQYLKNGECLTCVGFINKDDVCTPCPANGVCSGRTLTCKYGYKINPNNDEQCIPGCPDNEYLVENYSEKKCVACPENATCDGNTFTCNRNYKTNSTNDGCVAVCKSSEYRNASGVCTACPENAECNGESRFTCKIGYLTSDDGTACNMICRPGQYYDGFFNDEYRCFSCPKNATCDGVKPICNTGYNGYHVCNPNCETSKWYDPATKQCIACPNGATCNGATFTCGYGHTLTADNMGCDAMCPSDQFYDGTKCATCPDFAKCDGGDFTCADGYYKRGLKCVKPCKIPYEYWDGDQCSACPANASCANGLDFKCTTTNGYIPNEDNTACVSICRSDQYVVCTGYPDYNCTCHECPEYGTCKDGHSLKCADGFSPKYVDDHYICAQSCSSRQWWNGDSCTTCPQNATCDGMNFTCNQRYKKDGNGCTECPTGARYCDGEILDCAAGYHLDNGECRNCRDTHVEEIEQSIPLGTLSTIRYYTYTSGTAGSGGEEQCIGKTYITNDPYHKSYYNCSCSSDAYAYLGDTRLNARTTGWVNMNANGLTLCHCGCRENYYVDDNNQCRACPADMVSYGVNCVIQCKSNEFILDNKCVACPVGGQCNGEDFISCSQQYYMKDNDCVTCPSFAKCDGVNFTCNDKYERVDDVCLPICNVHNYRYKDNTTCTSCPDTSGIPGTSVCTGTNFECAWGYEKYDNEAARKYECRPLCEYPRQYWSGAKCIDCPENTKSCDADSFVCDDKYEPDPSGKRQCVPKQYKLTLDLNGGTGKDSCATDVTWDVTNRAVYPNSKCVPKRSGYEFVGWYTERDAGRWVYCLGESYKDCYAYYDDITLYARWSPCAANQGDASCDCAAGTGPDGNGNCVTCDTSCKNVSGFTMGDYNQCSTVADNVCYRQCDVADVPHATAVTGTITKGGASECKPTSCADGYTIDDTGRHCIANGSYQITYHSAYYGGIGCENEITPFTSTTTNQPITTCVPTNPGKRFIGWYTDVYKETAVTCVGTDPECYNAKRSLTLYAFYELCDENDGLGACGCDATERPDGYGDCKKCIKSCSSYSIHRFGEYDSCDYTETTCWRPCTPDDVPNSTAVEGHAYGRDILVNDNTKECRATACDSLHTLDHITGTTCVPNSRIEILAFYDQNGGVGCEDEETSVIIHNKNQRYRSVTSCTPTKPGSKFDGWYTSDGEKVVCLAVWSGDTDADGNLCYYNNYSYTLYAHYTACDADDNSTECGCAYGQQPDGNGGCTTCVITCPMEFPNGTYNLCDGESDAICSRACVASDIANAETVTGSITKGGVNTCAVTKCKSNYYIGANGACAVCPENALTCGDTNNPNDFTCRDGYDKTADGCAQKTFTVTLDKQNGTGGTDNVTATFGAAMPTATMPTRASYTFGGYYDAISDGKQYYNASGQSAANWDKTTNATLYARWTMCDASNTDGACNCAAGTRPDGNGNCVTCNIACPSEFPDGTYSQCNDDSDTACSRKCTTDDLAHSTGVTGTITKGGVRTCKATGCDTGYQVNSDGLCTVNTAAFKVSYNTTGGTGCTDGVAFGPETGNVAANCTPVKPGNNFVGWFTSETDGTRVTCVGTDDGCYHATESITLYAHWTHCDASNTDGACNCATGTRPDGKGNCVTCNIACPSEFPNKSYNQCNDDSNTACWRDCAVSDVENATAVTGTITKGGARTCAATKCKTGFFVVDGGCDTCPANATCNGDEFTCHDGYDKTANGCTPKIFIVTLDKQNGTGGTDKVTATFDATMPTATMPTRASYTFGGYYDAISDGKQYYNASGQSAANWDKTTNATLYARWTMCDASNTDGACNCATGTRPDGKGNCVTCNIACPSEFPDGTYSQCNDDSDTACSRKCTTDDLAHSTGVTGTITKGGVRTCKATGCDTGYQVNSDGLCAVNDAAFKVSYNTTGGTGCTDGVAFGPETGNVAANCTPVKSGNNFVGWFTSETGGTRVTCVGTDDGCYHATDSITLYAHWTHCDASNTDGACNCATGTRPDGKGNCVTCNIACPSEFPNKSYNQCNDDSDTACWRECAVSDVANATAVTGTITKGGVRTCAATKCKSDMFVVNGVCTACPTNAVCDGTKFTCNNGYEVNGNGCAPKTFTVTFDKRGGTGGTDKVTATFGATMPTATMPTRVNYKFDGYYDTQVGGVQYYDANGAPTKNWDKAADTTLYAQWTQVAVQCELGRNSNGDTCRDGYWCPGENVPIEDANDPAKGCERLCPTDVGGGKVTTGGGADNIAACRATRGGYTTSAMNGVADRTCLYNSDSKKYDTACTIVITGCNAGYWRDGVGADVCSVADIGYYSPANDLARYECAALDGADKATVSTNITTATGPNACFNVCDNIKIENGTRIASKAKVYYNGQTIPQCTYTTSCETGYVADGDVCVSRVFTVTLNHGGGTSETSAIYLKYNVGWYSDADATTPITTVKIPTRSGGYNFGGYKTSSGAVVVDTNGQITTNYTMFTANATASAAWIIKDDVNCAAGTYYSGFGRECVPCPTGSYCPGVSITEDKGAEYGRNECPKSGYTAARDSDGNPMTVTISSAAGATDATQCFATNVAWNITNGTGRQTCYYDGNRTYASKCTDRVVMTCDGGYWYDSANIDACTMVGVGNYSPKNDMARYECASLDGADKATVTTATATSADASGCYNVCADIKIDNGYRTRVNEKEFYDGTSIPACRYKTSCDKGYVVNDASCDALVLVVTLNNNGGEGTMDAIYLKYNAGWYSDAATTNPIKAVTVPTRSGGYNFGGYKTSTNVLITDKNGTLTTNYTIFMTNTTVTAIWTTKDDVTCDKGTYYPGLGTKCVICPIGSYCPGVSVTEDIGVEYGRNECPKSGYTAATTADGTALSVTVTSDVGATSATQCYATNVMYAARNGTGRQTCYYASNRTYTASCLYREMLTCNGGYWYAANVTTEDCTAVGFGYYSGTRDMNRYACPNLDSSDYVGTKTTTGTDISACYMDNILYTPNGGHGTQRRRCYHTVATTGGYTEKCDNAVMVTCDAGYWDDGHTVTSGGERDCTPVGIGYYSPEQSFFTGEATSPNKSTPGTSTRRSQCPGNGQTETTTSGRRVTDCYQMCKNTKIRNGTGIPTARTMFWTGKDYPTCTYRAACNAGYTPTDSADMTTPSCTECPTNHYCAAGDTGDDYTPTQPQACPPDYPKSDVGARGIEQCYRDCGGTGDMDGRDYYGTYPSKCTVVCESENGNPGELVDDGRGGLTCVETACRTDMEMRGGKCVDCNREHALGYLAAPADNCTVSSCEDGWRPLGDRCVPETEPCAIENAISASRRWDSAAGTYGACVIEECADGYHIEDNACVSDVRACTVPNGVGEQEWNDKVGKWGKCIATSCAPGFTTDTLMANEIAIARDGGCANCANKYGIDGEIVASSYVTECEIAACMYQGERYALDNGECMSICNTYEDETGFMRWNPVTQKCDRTCGPGYVAW